MKNAEALERLEKVTTLVVDKTGTLTEGRPRVVGIETADGFNETELLRLAATVAKQSEHPLSAAIVASAKERDVAAFVSSAGDDPLDAQRKPVAGLSESGWAPINLQLTRTPAGVSDPGYSGHGLRSSPQRRAAESLRAWAEGREHRQRGISTRSARHRQTGRLAAPRQQHGETVVFAAINERAAGFFAIADPIKATTPEAIRELHALGLKIVMLTGDNQRTADAVAKSLGIDEVHAGVARRKRARTSSHCGVRGTSSRWRATASTTHRRWRWPTWASRWGPAPTWRCRAAA